MSETPLLLGDYSRWLAEQMNLERVPEYSFLNPAYKDVGKWREQALKVFESFILAPELAAPKVALLWTKNYDGLQIEKLSWQLPFGGATEAYFLKPENHKGPLPAILGLHDHGVNKRYGKSKIVRTEDATPTPVVDYQEEFYGGRAWANELAKLGFAVLVHDVFPFESRRMLPNEMPKVVIDRIMQEEDPELETLEQYNEFARRMETIIAKSIFTSGLTWPGITLAEDRAA